MCTMELVQVHKVVALIMDCFLFIFVLAVQIFSFLDVILCDPGYNVSGILFPNSMVSVGPQLRN